ncbi:hypothetical protein bcgnr5378_05940 [Bacillus cereus]|uniref:Uncharacterized protein n=1 Tax=Bacillus cereus TaxID=1396 RepID=A0A162NW84_BACCE|nr:hypothetical protein [Bacillus cereus]KZD55633.1 hypothetical protein B4088_5378 [Bacillus cereus]
MKNTLTIEQIESAKRVYEAVKQLEKKYNSLDDRKLRDIELCFADSHILMVWETEKDDWNSFEDFLISFIQQNIELG